MIEEKPTPEQWAKWYSHKSNKERFIEQEEAALEREAWEEVLKEELENK